LLGGWLMGLIKSMETVEIRMDLSPNELVTIALALMDKIEQGRYMRTQPMTKDDRLESRRLMATLKSAREKIFQMLWSIGIDTDEIQRQYDLDD